MKRNVAVPSRPGITKDEVTGTYGFVVGQSTPGGHRRQIRRRGYETPEAAESARDSLKLLLAGGARRDDALAMLDKDRTEEVLAHAAALILDHIDRQAISERFFAAGAALGWLERMHDEIWTRVEGLPSPEEWTTPEGGAFSDAV